MIDYLRVEKRSLDETLTQEDCNAFHELLKQYYNQVKKERPELAEQKPPQGIADVQQQVKTLQQGNVPDYDDNYLLALHSKPIGFISYRNKEQICQETHWCIHEQHRGQGIGRQLMKNFVEHNTQQGYTTRVYNPTPAARYILEELQAKHPIEIVRDTHD